MAKISVATNSVDSTQTTSTSIEFAGELLDLDTDFADVAWIEIYYTPDGTDTDGNLVNPQHNSDFDLGLFSLGTFVKTITNLAADTQYHYKIKGKTVTYDNMVIMSDAVLSKGLMNDVAKSSTSMTEIVNNENIMIEVANSSTAMTEVVESQDIVEFYQSDYNDTFLNTFWETQENDVSIGANHIYIYTNNQTISSITSTSIDLTDLDSLLIDWEDISTGNDDNHKAQVLIDGSTVLTKLKADPRSEDTVDISSYSGNHNIKVKTSGSGSYTNYDVGFAVYSLYVT